jgi:predicted kinase
MREWMREQLMRRRSKRGPNDSESTGKIGQELPANQLAPLRPAYPEPQAATPAQQPPAAPPTAERNEAAPAPAPAEGQKARSGRGRRRRGGRGPRKDKPEALAPGTAAASPVYDTDADAGSDDPELDSPEAGDDYDPDAEPDGPEPEPAPQATGKLVLETQPDSPSTPPPAPQPAGGPKQPRGFVVLTIGLPGSGKTTWFKRRSVTPLSSDMLRGILFDDITEQRYQGLVFSTLRSLLRARLIAKMPWNYVDATNLSPHERRQWIKMATSFGYDVHAVFFDVPFEVCMERNHRRERVVSDEVMHKMNERLRPPSFKEGFSKITVVRVKGVPGSMSTGSAQAAVEDTPGGEAAEESGE